MGSEESTQEKKLDVAEMRVLRWMSGVTKLERIRNERNRGTTNVGEISKKVQEIRLKWYGHTCIQERRRICGQESDGAGGAREKKARKTKAEVVG